MRHLSFIVVLIVLTVFTFPLAGFSQSCSNLTGVYHFTDFKSNCTGELSTNQLALYKDNETPLVLDPGEDLEIRQDQCQFIHFENVQSKGVVMGELNSEVLSISVIPGAMYGEQWRVSGNGIYFKLNLNKDMKSRKMKAGKIFEQYFSRTPAGDLNVYGRAVEILPHTKDFALQYDCILKKVD